MLVIGRTPTSSLPSKRQWCGAVVFSLRPSAASTRPTARCGVSSRLQVVFVSTEVAPWSKTGGLGDVAAALPASLASRGHQVMTVSPRYADYPGVYDTGLLAPVEVAAGVVDAAGPATPHAPRQDPSPLPQAPQLHTGVAATLDAAAGSSHSASGAVERSRETGAGPAPGQERAEAGCSRGGMGLSPAGGGDGAPGSARSSGVGRSAAAAGPHEGGGAAAEAGRAQTTDPQQQGKRTEPAAPRPASEGEPATTISYARFYACQDRGVLRVFVDHPVFRGGAGAAAPHDPGSQQGGGGVGGGDLRDAVATALMGAGHGDPSYGVYTYSEGVPHLDLQARNSVLCQAALAAPVLFWHDTRSMPGQLQADLIDADGALAAHALPYVLYNGIAQPAVMLEPDGRRWLWESLQRAAETAALRAARLRPVQQWGASARAQQRLNVAAGTGAGAAGQAGKDQAQREGGEGRGGEEAQLVFVGNDWPSALLPLWLSAYREVAASTAHWTAVLTARLKQLEVPTPRITEADSEAAAPLAEPGSSVPAAGLSEVHLDASAAAATSGGVSTPAAVPAIPATAVVEGPAGVVAAQGMRNTTLAGGAGLPPAARLDSRRADGAAGEAESMDVDPESGRQQMWVAAAAAGGDAASQLVPQPRASGVATVVLDRPPQQPREEDTFGHQGSPYDGWSSGCDENGNSHGGDAVGDGGYGVVCAGPQDWAPGQPQQPQLDPGGHQEWLDGSSYGEHDDGEHPGRDQQRKDNNISQHHPNTQHPVLGAPASPPPPHAPPAPVPAPAPAARKVHGPDDADASLTLSADGGGDPVLAAERLLQQQLLMALLVAVQRVRGAGGSGEALEDGGVAALRDMSDAEVAAALAAVALAEAEAKAAEDATSGTDGDGERHEQQEQQPQLRSGEGAGFAAGAGGASVPPPQTRMRGTLTSFRRFVASRLKGAKVVFAVHNLAFQGLFAEETFWRLGLPLLALQQMLLGGGGGAAPPAGSTAAAASPQLADGSSNGGEGDEPPAGAGSSAGYAADADRGAAGGASGSDSMATGSEAASGGRTVSWLKAALLSSDAVVTVSPGYAKELSGDPDQPQGQGGARGGGGGRYSKEPMMPQQQQPPVSGQGAPKRRQRRRRPGLPAFFEELQAIIRGRGGIRAVMNGLDTGAPPAASSTQTQSQGSSTGGANAAAAAAPSRPPGAPGSSGSVWDPATDRLLPPRLRYGPGSELGAQEGKARAKAELQAQLGLAQEPDVPLFGFIGRLDSQKGVDVILGALPYLMGQAAGLGGAGTGGAAVRSVTQEEAGGADAAVLQAALEAVAKIGGAAAVSGTGGSAVTNPSLQADYGAAGAAAVQSAVEAAAREDAAAARQLPVAVVQLLGGLSTADALSYLTRNPGGNAAGVTDTATPSNASSGTPAPGGGQGRPPLQVALLGVGDAWLQDALGRLPAAYPRHAAGVVGFNEPLAHLMMAGCDFLIIPSRWEPCGLVALAALRYGTVPIVAPTGGLPDVLRLPELREEGSSAGSSSSSSAVGAAGGLLGLVMDREVGPQDDSLAMREAVASLVRAVRRARAVYGTAGALDELRGRCMAQDVSWDRPAAEWEELLWEVATGRERRENGRGEAV